MNVQIYKIFIVFLVVLAACKSAVKENNPETPPSNNNTLVLTDAQLKNTEVRIGKLQNANIGNELQVNGMIEVPPQNLVGISFPLGGYLRSTHLLPGTHVRKGELIAWVEDQQYIDLQRQYLTSKAQMNYLKKEVARQNILQSENASSQKEAQIAEMNYKSELINLEALAEKLRMLGMQPHKLSADKISKKIAIYSPIDGFVAKVNVIIGRYFNPSDELFELVDPRDIHLNLKIYQQDLSKIKVGQKVWCYLPTEPTERYVAEIILVSKNVSENNTVEVHCHFHEYNAKLIPGVFMNANIIMESSPLTAAPDGAIVGFEGKSFIYLAKDNYHFELKEVQAGKSENGYRAISGVDTSARYVLNDAYTLFLEMNKTKE